MKMERPNTDKELELFEGNAWILPTDISVISDADDVLVKKLKIVGWDTNSNEVSGMVEFAFHEALMNAIVHGNLGIVKSDDDENLGQLAIKEQVEHPTDKKVFVTLEISQDRVSIKIRDEGNGFNPETVQSATSSDAQSKTKGRGIAWMRNYFDSVTYNKMGNEVTMVKEKKK